MASRLIRIHATEFIQHIDKHVGIEADFVLRDNSVVHGRITKFDKESITITDYREHKHKVALTEIAEMILSKTN